MIKSIFHRTKIYSALCFGLLLPLSDLQSGMMPGYKPNDQQIEKMQKAMQDINDELMGMTPEQQANFFKQVEEAQRVIDAMSPEEKKQLWDEMAELMPEYFEDMPVEFFDPTLAQPEISAPEVTVTTEARQDQILSDKEKEILNLIEDIIRSTNAFVVKIQSSPEVAGNVERWGKAGKIANWPQNTIWTTFLSSIDLFNNNLIALKEQDAVSKLYLHLKEASESEALVKLLKEFHQIINDLIPKIEIPSFGLDKMSAENKELLQKTIDAYAKIIFKDKVNDLITSIIAKYGPQAKKLKEAEKISAQRAQQQAARPVAPGRSVTAGKPTGEGEEFGFGRPEEFGGLGGGYDFGAPGYYGNTGQYGTERRAGSEEAKTPTAPKTVGGGAPAAGGGKGITKKESDPATDKLVGEIESKMSDVSALVDEDPHLKDIKQHLFNAQQAEPDILTTMTIPRIEKRASELVSQIKSLERKIENLNQTMKTNYIKDIRESYDKHKSSFNKIIKDLEPLQKEWESQKSKISPEKQHAYFKEAMPAPKKPAEGQPELPVKPAPQQSTKTLFELMSTLKKLKNTVNKFGEKTKK